MSDSLPDEHSLPSVSPDVSDTKSESEEFKAWKQQCASHRIEMQKTENAMIDEFAKALMTLSAAAIGVSLTILKDVIKLERVENPSFMLWAWTCWTASLAFTVSGYYTSHHANRIAVRAFDTIMREKRYEDLYTEVPRNLLNLVTRWLTPIAGGLFFIGLLLMVLFVSNNFTYGRTSASTSPATNTTGTAAATTNTAAGTNAGQAGGATTRN